jgi:glycosyltransferase involved in cell wall biosynthesis
MTRLAAAQRAWRRIPLRLRRLAAPLLGWATQSYARGRRPVAAAGLGPLPIKVVGLFSAASGIAASARLAVRAFEALGVPVEAVDAGADGLDFSRRLAGPAAPAIWIFHLNPPELLAALASLGPRKVVGPRYGYWAWELPKAPRRWLSDARVVDEVWTPSRYSADALTGAAAPVRVVPHPLFAQDYDAVEPLPRRAPFQAVAVFDFRSSMARKNPLGAIEAFRRAFGDDPACELTLKTQNGGDFPEQLAALRAALPPNARLIDEVWPYAEVKRLIAGADVLISLHRGEGFGLTPAEAMALGTPILATAYSGVLDFLDETCAVLVPCVLTPVADPQGVYRGQTWAEPDLDAAAAGLRRLREDAWLRSTLAEAARRRVAERLSPAAWFATLPESVRAATTVAEIRVNPASRAGPVSPAT